MSMQRHSQRMQLTRLISLRRKWKQPKLFGWKWDCDTLKIEATKSGNANVKMLVLFKRVIMPLDHALQYFATNV